MLAPPGEATAPPPHQAPGGWGGVPQWHPRALTHAVLPVPVQPPARGADALVAALGVDAALVAAAVVYAALVHVWKHRRASRQEGAGPGPAPDRRAKSPPALV